MAGGESRVQFCEFVDENPERPSVGNNVVHHCEQQVVFRREPENIEPQQRRFFEIEGALHILMDQQADLLFLLCL